MKAKYTVSFTANGTTAGTYSGYTSKKAAIEAAKGMCKGNVFAGNSGRWEVIDSDGMIIAKGKVEF